MKLLLGAILLLLVGCSGVVQAQGEEVESQIAALTQRIDALEEEAVQFLVKQVQLYGPSYTASRCLEGVEPTAAGFRDFVTQTYSNGVGPGRAAQWAIQLVDNEIKRLNNSNEEPTLCLQPYLYPESTADAGPAIELYLAAVIPSLPTRFRGGIESLTVHRAGGWFNDTARQQPFIIWLCEGSSDNPCGLPTAEDSPQE